MKVIVDRSGLLKALGRARGIVEKRTSVPILSNVLIAAGDGDILTLSSTDLEIAITESIPVERLEKKGTITVPVQMFFDIVSRLPEDSLPELSFNPDEKEGSPPLSIRSGRSTFRLSTLPAHEYAVIKKEDFPFSFTIKTSDLGDLLERTRYAISMEETRYYLNGLYFELSNKDKTPLLRAVSTDGHRLAKAEVTNIQFQKDIQDESFPGIIIPQKTVGEIIKLLDTKVGEVMIAFSSTSISFASGEINLTSRLIDGAFPEYEKVIPKDNPFLLKVSTLLFRDAVDRVAVMASDKTHTIKLMIQDGTLALSSSSPHAGTAFEEMEVDYIGESFEMGFNARYLLDAARHIKGEVLTIAMRDAASAILLQDENEPGLAYVIMPMRV